MVEHDASYYEAFGEFMHRYSRVETLLHFLFRYCLGAGMDKGRKLASAIAGGMRSSDLMSLIRRVAKVRDLPEATQIEIDAIFSHLSAISLLRDYLVHRGTTAAESGLISENTFTAKVLEDVQVLKLNLDDIKKATLDCKVMFLRLTAICYPEAKSLKLQITPKLLVRPWSYKPRQPDTPYRLPRKGAQSRKRQPPASHGSR